MHKSLPRTVSTVVTAGAIAFSVTAVTTDDRNSPVVLAAATGESGGNPYPAAGAGASTGPLAAAPALQDAPAADRPGSAAAARGSALLPAGRWVHSQLAAGGDADWFRFRVRRSRSVQLLLGGAPAQYRLVLADSRGRTITVSDRGARQFEEILHRLPTGEYFAGVSATGIQPTGHPYRLLLRHVPGRLAILDAHRGSAAGLLTITGQLLNNSGAWRRHSRVTAHFTDAQGRPAGTSTALAEHDLLAPGQRTAFRVAAPPLAAGAAYRLSVSSAWSPAVPASAAGQLTAESDQPYEVAGKKVRYVGQVRGRGNGPVRVHVLRYNRIGALVDYGHALLPDVSPESPGRYEIELPAHPYVSGERVLVAP
jgi:hypothetical protein